MQIPCALCKKHELPDGIEPATEDLPLCSKCLKEYGDVLRYAYEQAIYDYFKYGDSRSSFVTLESLRPITKRASKYASSIITVDDLYLSGMYLRYLYRDEFVRYQHKELLYYLVASAGSEH